MGKLGIQLATIIAQHKACGHHLLGPYYKYGRRIGRCELRQNRVFLVKLCTLCSQNLHRIHRKVPGHLTVHHSVSPLVFPPCLPSQHCLHHIRPNSLDNATNTWEKACGKCPVYCLLTPNLYVASQRIQNASQMALYSLYSLTRALCTMQGIGLQFGTQSQRFVSVE